MRKSGKLVTPFPLLPELEAEKPSFVGEEDIHDIAGFLIIEVHNVAIGVISCTAETCEHFISRKKVEILMSDKEISLRIHRLIGSFQRNTWRNPRKNEV